MDQGLLMTEGTDAGAELVRWFENFVPVDVAFWLKASDDTRWYFYIASDRFEDHRLDAAYGEILRLAAEMADPDLDPFEVNLIPTSDPLAQAALEINRRYPGLMPTRFGGTNFGGMSVEGVYLYPPTVLTAAS